MILQKNSEKPLEGNGVGKRFGAMVKDWRNRIGLSQEELAFRACLHRTYISDIERGVRNISLCSIRKLATALEVSLPTLFSQFRGNSDPPALINDERVDILLVEDSSEDIALTMRTLESGNVTNRIYVVRDGAAALDFLSGIGEFASRRAADHPQIILLDLHLPKIDGLEVLRQIKADPRTRAIPVVVLTASKYSHDIIASRRLGAATYIVKPVGFENFSAMTLQLSLQWTLLKPANPPPIGPRVGESHIFRGTENKSPASNPASNILKSIALFKSTTNDQS